MNKERLKKLAEKNEFRKNHIKESMQIALLHLNSIGLANDWIYDLETKTYQKWFTPFEVQSYDWVNFMYDKLEFEFKGCTLVAQYDHWEDRMESKVIIPANNEDPAVSSLVSALNSKRSELKEAWISNVTQVAKDYFEIHKEEFTKYPTVKALRSKPICVWTNGATKKVKPCHKIVELLKTTINNSRQESLDGYYSPSVWDNNEQTETTLRLYDGLILHIRRDYGISEDLMYYPPVYISFEMLTSNDLTFNCALEVQREQKRANAYAHFFDFVESFKKEGNWFLSKDNRIECIIPIIYEEDADFILRMAKKTYGDEYEFSLTEREIPLFDNGLHKCIYCQAL